VTFFDRLDGLDEKLAGHLGGPQRRMLLLGIYGGVLALAALAFLVGVVSFSPGASTALLLAGPYVLTVAVAFELGRTLERERGTTRPAGGGPGEGA
jgi:hypothetical protein